MSAELLYLQCHHSTPTVLLYHLGVPDIHPSAHATGSCRRYVRSCRTPRANQAAREGERHRVGVDDTFLLSFPSAGSSAGESAMNPGSNYQHFSLMRRGGLRRARMFLLSLTGSVRGVRYSTQVLTTATPESPEEGRERRPAGRPGPGAPRTLS